MATPMDSLDDVKRHLGVSGTADDDLLDRLADAATDFIRAYCGRSFAGGSVTEYHPGGGRVLFLAEFPVTAVTGLRVDPDGGFGPETVRDPGRYAVHADRGVIESTAGPWVRRPGVRADDFPRAVRVEYTAPAEVPAAVRRVYAELIGHWYRQSKTSAHLGQLNVQSRDEAGVETAYPWGQSGGFRLPAGVRQVLDRYRVPAV